MFPKKEYRIEIHPNAEVHANEEITQFLKSFDGVKITNSNGKEITLTCGPDSQSPGDSNSDVLLDVWKIEFSGYPGADEGVPNPNGPYDLMANYVLLAGNPENTTIYITYALLNHPDLKSKDVYPQIRKLIGQNIPEGYKLFTEIDHKQSKKQFQDIFKRLQSSEITTSQAQEEITNNYKVQQRLLVGFNKFTVNFEGNGNIVELISEKNPTIQSPETTITIDGSPLT